MFFFLLTFCHISKYLIESRCSPGWTKFGRSCYKSFNDKMFWHDAKARCQQYGASLVAINNANEHNFVKSLTSQLYGDYAVWIGLRRDSQGAFSRWDNGQPLTYTRWTSNEPNNIFGDEDCVEMYKYSGGWLDTTCTGDYARSHPFICEIGKFSIATKKLTYALLTKREVN